jgi:hypothetical protein
MWIGVPRTKVRMGWAMGWVRFGWTWRDGDRPDLEVSVDAMQGFLKGVSADGSRFVTMDDIEDEARMRRGDGKGQGGPDGSSDSERSDNEEPDSEVDEDEEDEEDEEEEEVLNIEEEILIAESGGDEKLSEMMTTTTTD